MRTRLLVPALAALASCGPTVQRNLMEIPQQRITYDDMCRLQDYFDQRAQAGSPAFRVLNEHSNETSNEEPDEHGRMRRVVLGEGTYVIASRTDRRRLRHLLREEYRRLPPMRLNAEEGEVRVRIGWWQSGTIRRVRPDMDVEITGVDGATHTLPPHPCLGEFLFGDEPYAMRRNVMEAERARARGELPAAYLHADAGADAGADVTPSHD